MKEIEEILNQRYDLRTNTIFLAPKSIWLINEDIVCMVIMPCKSTNNKWLIRFSTIFSFNNWKNSISKNHYTDYNYAVEEFFDTKADVVRYLVENQADIYKQILKYIRKQHTDM